HADSRQAIVHRLLVPAACGIGVRPNDNFTVAERGPIRLVGAFAAVRARHRYIVRQELLRGIGRLLALGDKHFGRWPLREFVQPIKRSRGWPALPAPFQLAVYAT